MRPRASEFPGSEAPGTTDALPDRAEAAASRSLPLSALRGLHASHRQLRSDLDATELRNAGSSTGARRAATDAADTTALASAALAPGLLVAASTNTPVAATSGLPAPSDQLQSLIESCCDRLWISDGRGHAPQGVMLDLGRWMPGCTIEIARAAGVLHLQMRGVDDARRRDVEQHLESLGETLADKLGCQVVSAVSGQKEQR